MGDASMSDEFCRLAVDVVSWRLEAMPRESMESGYLLTLVNDEQERAAVLRFLKAADQKRALVSRLLAQASCARALDIPFRSVRICRTKGRKPYCPAAKGFNFNISHEGDYVVLASERECLVGVDVCSAHQIERLSAEDLERSFRSSFTQAEWNLILEKGIFSTFWSLKESFVKARGDGLRFELGRLDFSKCDGTLLLDTELQKDWHFDVEQLDAKHVASVARGPYEAIVDEIGDFKKTMPRTNTQAIFSKERPPFRKLEVDDLLPEEYLERLLTIRSNFHHAPLSSLSSIKLRGRPGLSDNNLFLLRSAQDIQEDDHQEEEEEEEEKQEQHEVRLRGAKEVSPTKLQQPTKKTMKKQQQHRCRLS